MLKFDKVHKLLYVEFTKSVLGSNAPFVFKKVDLYKPLILALTWRGITSIKHMILFFIGILEMLIVTTWTKFVTKTRILASGVVTMINVLIWFYVLQRIVTDINNWKVALLYAFGCSVGTVLSTYYFHLDENAAHKPFSNPQSESKE